MAFSPNSVCEISTCGAPGGGTAVRAHAGALAAASAMSAAQTTRVSDPRMHAWSVATPAVVTPPNGARCGFSTQT
jgi:hypothetical protein